MVWGPDIKHAIQVDHWRKLVENHRFTFSDEKLKLNKL